MTWGDAGPTAAGLESILDAVTAAVSVWDHETRLVYVNATALHLLGGNRAEILGRTMADVLGPEAMAAEILFVSKVLAGEPQEREIAVEIDGQVRTHEVFLRPIIKDGSVTHYVTASLDNTDRRAAQQVAQSNDAIAAIRADRHRIAAELNDEVITRLDRAMSELTKAETSDGAGFRTFREAASGLIDDVIRRLRATIIELKTLPADDAGAPGGDFVPDVPPLPVLITAPPASEPDPIGATAEELMQVLDSLPISVIATDRDFRLTFVNRQMVESYGLPSRESILGKHASEAIGPAGYQASLPYANAALAGEPQQFMRSLVGHDGQPRHQEVNYLPQRVNGEVRGVAAVVRDVTADVEVDLAFRTSAERLAVLGDRERIAEDVHDLVIQHLFAAGLMFSKETSSDPSRLREARAAIADAVSELKLCVHGLRGEDVGVDLRGAVSRTVRQATPTLGFQPDVAWTGEPTNVPVELSTEVIAVLSEALSNATRHAHASQINIHVDIRADSLRLVVADNGRGLSNSGRHSGLANMAVRAQRHGGEFSCRPNDPTGTVIDWRISLLDSAAPPAD